MLSIQLMNRSFLSHCLVLISCCIAFNANALIVGTYSAPPFSMFEDGEEIGMATEAIRDLLAKSGISDYKIENFPLARGLVELKYGRIDIFYPYMILIKGNTENYTLIG